MPRKETPAAPPAAGPRLNLPLFLLALLGVLVVLHLGLQQRAGFALGCTGLGDPTSGRGCAEVTSSRYGSLLGVDLTLWGGLFYLVLAALRAGVAATRPPTSHSLRTASLAFSSLGFLFVLYLVGVQAFVLKQFCTLCLVSAGIVTLLFALHVAERVKGPGPAAFGSVPLRPYLLGALALVVLAGADVLWSRGGPEGALPSPVAQTPTSGHTPEATVPPTIDGTIPEGCRYDTQLPTLSIFEDLVALGLPSEGSEEASVHVLKIFDPNCPHCRTLHGVLKQTVPQVSDEGRFYYQPMALWDISVPQIQALFLAREQGKFFEMLDVLFANQEAFAQLHRQGNSPEWLPQVTARLVELAGQAGLDAEALREGLAERKYQALILRQRQALAEAGISSVPRLVIDGRVVANTQPAWTPQCIGGLVMQEAQEASSASEAAAGG